ncbi:MAG: hypothetical protein JWL84_3298 [Rhodospirillales bacterium]|jgi:hypothetical protein|nr:hypothetical protein [Rhodospirillales bacterium]
MVEALHHAVWVAYRRAMRADSHWNASAAFQAAVDVLLAHHPEIAPEPACRLAVRMITLGAHSGAAAENPTASHGRRCVP